jgi:glycosyltransferase involved in cell wall biosynthesis
MKLLIVSHTPHHERDGMLVGWGPTVREISHLTGLFDEVIHVAPVHDEPAPESALDYQSDRVTVRPIRPAGGIGLRRKLGILARLPEYVGTIVRELRQADALHVRCPSNISLAAIVLAAFTRRPRARWFKYAGNWRPPGQEAWSYSFQRWWLKRGLSRGIVTVNGSWPGQPPFVRPFLNPCLTGPELEEARQAAAEKSLSEPLRLIFVGRLETEKGAGRAIEILARVRRESVAATLDLVGDGPERAAFERLARERGVSGEAIFRGWVPRPALSPLYRRSHFMLLPSSCSEGWPKVLGEAMAYGVVPVASNVSCIPQILGATNADLSLEPCNLAGFAATVVGLAGDPERWKSASRAAVGTAQSFTYDRYLTAVGQLFQEMGLSTLSTSHPVEVE